MHLSGVHLLRSRSDGISLAEAVRKASRAVVLGAGFIGMEAASALRSRGLDVLVVAPERLPLQGIFGERIARRVLQLHQAKGVRFALGAPAAGIAGEPGRSLKVSLANGTVREADLVVVGAGGVPAAEILRGSTPLRAGALPVDRMMATAVPGVFAAGDAALVPYGPAGRLEEVGHWVDAERQGQAAARAILRIEGSGFTDERFFWTEQHGASLTAVGQTGRDPAAFRGDPEGGEFLAGYFRDSVLVGAAALGYGREIAWLAGALSEGRGVSPKTLADPGVDLLALR
jgi:NADPH-dependent 2,4-dienoyl-CoA reductase/sulfur reductase-like enzyme